MAIFSKTPEKLLTDKIDAAKKNAERLAARLLDAERAVINAKTVSQACALSGDDTGLDAAEATERAAAQRHVTILAARAEAGNLLADLETQLDSVNDKRVRAATAAATNNLADEMIEAGDNYLTATKLFHAVCSRALTVTQEAQGLEAFTRASGTEVALALPVVAEVLREYGRAVLQGFAKAEMPVAEAPFKPVPITKPATRPLFATRGICWTENGQLRVGRKFTDVDLPVEIAARAIKARVCVEMNDPLRNRQTINSWPGHPDAASCFNLDAGVVASVQDIPVAHSDFKVVDRGKPYALKIAVATS
jgi:hypothetical protein